MVEISREALFGRLSPEALQSIETATGFCSMRGNAYVELAHWLHTLSQDRQGDVASIFDHYGVDRDKLGQGLIKVLDALPRGATAVTDFSPHILEAIEKGWLYASLQFGSAQIRSGHILYAILKTPQLGDLARRASREFAKVKTDALADEFSAITKGSSEENAVEGVRPGQPSHAGASAEGASNAALSQFSVDLTANARDGKIDKIVGRDAEIRQVIDILLRRRQNNPILTGEAGVGKTAVVEGFAKRIADGDVPPVLRNVTLRSLDIGLLQAGASVKGEFEKRLRQVIDEVEASADPIILFIDEAHTLIGAGGAAGTGDAANLLKPALARGALRTVAATTWAEYRQYFEKDPALTRRFQTVKVDEPPNSVAIDMMRSVSGVLQNHHNVPILDEALSAAVTLSQRYIPARQLPDKAVSLLDTACARVAVSQHGVPAPVEDVQRRLEALKLEREIAEREAGLGVGDAARAAGLDEDIRSLEEQLNGRKKKWDTEKSAVQSIVKLLDADGGGGSGNGDRPERMRAAMTSLSEAQGDDPMVFAQVDAAAVAAVVGDWTGIPVGNMVKDEVASVLNIAGRLKERVIGQDFALEEIAKRVKTSRAKLDNPNKPVGVFMLCGPSGVGKTETAHALSELLYAGDESLIVINMSEFQEAHTVSTLKGAPAGYVGYGQGGVLTEAVRRRPYSVVLLDEIEKAHPDVHEMFFQVFDKGYMDDSEGRFIDFRNCLILLTSNVGTEMITEMAADPETAPLPEALATALRTDLLTTFPPALLGRLVVLPYYPLSPDVLGGIVRIQLGRIRSRIADNHKIEFGYGDDVVDHIVSKCTELASGGRMIDNILTNAMLPEISTTLLGKIVSGETVSEIKVKVANDALAYDFK